MKFMIGEIAIIVIILTCWVYQSIRGRLSPAYAAKREVREQHKADQRQLKVQKQREKRRLKQTKKEAKVLEWAREHPNSPIAQSYLAQQMSEATNHENMGVVDPIAEELRRKQSTHDTFERDKKIREQHDMVLLNWALTHPTTQEGKRHLKEVLDKTSKDLEHASRMLGWAKQDLERADDNSPEAIEATTKITEYEAEQQTARQRIYEIEEALSSSTSVIRKES